MYRVIRRLLITYGKQYSRIRPRIYSWNFIGGDIAIMLMQIAGGGIAARASEGSSGAEIGKNLLIAGLTSQVVTMAFCACLWSTTTGIMSMKATSSQWSDGL